MAAIDGSSVGSMEGAWNKVSIVGSAEGSSVGSTVGMLLMTTRDGVGDGTAVGHKLSVMGATKRSEGAVLGASDGTRRVEG